MFTLVLIVMLAGLLAWAGIRLQRPAVDPRVTLLLLGGYVLRLVISSATQDLNVFANSSTDYSGYEAAGNTIAILWRYTGIHYITRAEMPELLGEASLPSNMFAFISYLNGEPTHLGCTALVAALACLVCLNVYCAALLLGARPKVALGTMALITMLPSFLFYTSNTYKDGFVAFFVTGILACTVRLARTFSPAHLALAAALLGGLWLTRFYVVFVLPGPLLLGFLGLRSQSMFRTLFAALVVVASVCVLYAYSSAPQEVVRHARITFDGATSETYLTANAQNSGSGVTFESSSPTGAFVPKLLYTLFSPFPWQSGSLGLQLGKIEALAWYYFLYRAMLAAKILWREQRSDLLIFASFCVPMAVAYALTFSNIGLIVRQRLDVVLATMMLATVSWGRRQEDAQRTAVKTSGLGGRRPGRKRLPWTGEQAHSPVRTIR